MTGTTNLLGILVVIIIIEACAQYCTKRSFTTRDNKFLIFGMMLYGAVAMLLYASYKYSTMGLVNVMWNAGSTISIILIGMWFFHETINKFDMMGIIITFIGLYLIFVHGHTSELVNQTV